MSLADLGSLRVSVSLDSARFDQGVKAMNARMAALRSEYKAMNDGTKGWDKSISGLAAKQRMLTGLLDAQASKVRSLRIAYNEATAAHGANSAQADRAAAKLNNQIAQHNRLRNELRSTNAEYIRASSGAIRYANTLETASAVYSSAGNQMVSAGMTGAIVSAGLLGIGKNFVSTAMDYEYSMAKVRAVANLSSAEYEKLNGLARELGANTMFSATEAASGMLFLSMAGQNANQIFENTPKVLTLAQAGFMDLGLAADITTNIMTPFKLQASETARVVDVLAAAASNANTDIPMLGEAMMYLAPQASAVGWSVEETAAALMVFANNGLRGSIAGQAFASSLARLSEPTDKMAEVMDKYNIKIYDAEGNMKSLNELVPHVQKALSGLTNEQRSAAITTLFGVEAQKHWLALLNDSEGTLGTFTNKLQNAQGEAQRMADTMGNTFYGKVKALQSAFEELKISVGTEVMDKLGSGVQGLADAFRALSSSKVGSYLASIGTYATAAAVGFSALLLIFGNMARAIGTVSKGFATQMKKAKETQIAQAQKHKNAVSQIDLEIQRQKLLNAALEQEKRILRELNAMAARKPEKAQTIAAHMEGIGKVHPGTYAGIKDQDGLKAGQDYIATQRKLFESMKKTDGKMLGFWGSEIQGATNAAKRRFAETDRLYSDFEKQARKFEKLSPNKFTANQYERTPAPDARIGGETFFNMGPQQKATEQAIAASKRLEEQSAKTADRTKFHYKAMGDSAKLLEGNVRNVGKELSNMDKAGSMAKNGMDKLKEGMGKTVSMTAAFGLNIAKSVGSMALMGVQTLAFGAVLGGLTFAIGAATKSLVAWHNENQRVKNQPQLVAKEALAASQKQLEAARNNHTAAKSIQKVAEEYDKLRQKSTWSQDDFANYMGLGKAIQESQSEAEIKKLTAAQEGLAARSGLTAAEIKRLTETHSELVAKYPELAGFYGDYGELLIENNNQLLQVISAEERLAAMKYKESIFENIEKELEYASKVPDLLDDIAKKKSEVAEDKANLGIREEDLVRLRSAGKELENQHRQVVSQLGTERDKLSEITDLSSDEYRNQSRVVGELERKKNAIEGEIGANDRKLAQTEQERDDIQKALAAKEKLLATAQSELAIGMNRSNQIAEEVNLINQAVAAEVGVNYERGKGIAQFEERAMAINREIAELERLKAANGGLSDEDQARLDSLNQQSTALSEHLSFIDQISAAVGEDFVIDFKTTDAKKKIDDAVGEKKRTIDIHGDATQLDKVIEGRPRFMDVNVRDNGTADEVDAKASKEAIKPIMAIDSGGSVSFIDQVANRAGLKLITGADANGSVQGIDNKANKGATKSVQGVDAGGSVQSIDNKANKGATKSVQSIDGGGSLSSLISRASKGETKSVNFREGSSSISLLLAPLRNPISVAVDFFTRKKATNNYRGTLSHPGGWSYVGEMGRELGFIPGEGWQMLGQHGQELRDLPRGSKVIPNGLTEQIMKGKRKIPGYATGVGLEGVINVEVPKGTSENVYNINLNYSGSASKEEAMTMAQIVMDEIEKKERRNRRARGEKKFV